MTKSAVINPDPYCDVDTELLNMGGERSNKCVVRLRDPDTNQMRPLDTLGAIHNSETYALVTNRRLQQATHDVMTRSRLQFQPLPSYQNSKSTPVIWDGRKYIARYYTQDVTADIKQDDHEATSRIMLGMQITNSYDGSLNCAMEFFLMNMLCANQFYSTHMITGFNLKHYKSANNDIEFDLDDAVRAIEQQADQFGRLLPRFAALTGKQLSELGDGKSDLSGMLAFRQQLGNAWKPSYDCHVLDELANRSVTSRIEGLQSAGKSTRTLWDLLNSYTAVCTHQIGGFSGISTNRVVTDTALNCLKAA